MSRTSNQKQQRALDRHQLTIDLKARVRVLEDALYETWLWSSTDGHDLDRLRTILRKADRDAQLHAALDKIRKPT